MDDVKLNQKSATGDGPMPAAGATMSGQVAVVTGAGAGIGAAVAQHLSGAGAVVVAVDIDVDAASRTVAGCARHEATLARRTDVSDEADVARLFEEIGERFGRLDLLVNNAGVANVEPLESISAESWRHTFAVNVEGTLFAMKAAFPMMRTQAPDERTGCRGKIINMSSPAGELGRPLLAAYGASKAAVSNLGKSAAARWGEHQIATTIVYPGSVTGAMWPRLGYEMAAAEGRSAEHVVAERIAWAPSGRLQEPTEIAAIVLYVACFQGMGLNGRTIWTEPHVSLS